MEFTNQEYAEIVFCYGLANGNSGEARREYARRYPTRTVPSRAVFSRTYQRLCDTGSVSSSRHNAGAHGANVAIEEDILRRFEDDPTTSTRAEASR